MLSLRAMREQSLVGVVMVGRGVPGDSARPSPGSRQASRFRPAKMFLERRSAGRRLWLSTAAALWAENGPRRSPRACAAPMARSTTVNAMNKYH